MTSKQTLFCFLFCLTLPLQLLAQRMQDVRSEVKEATVFLNRAQLTSSAKATVQNGLTDLVINNLPTQIDEQSLQVNAKGNVVIYGVRFEQNYLGEFDKPKKLRQLEDSLLSLQNQLRTLTDQREIIQKEEALILANQQIGGEKGVEVIELEDMVDFFRSRMTNIRGNLLKLDQQIKLKQEEVRKFQNQLNQNPNRNVKPTGQVVVTVQAKERTAVALNINYLVHQAGWKPVYDIRVNDTNQAVKLNYKAQIMQNTGVDWQNVKLILSSASPSVAGAVKPELQPWHLRMLEREQQVANKLSIKGSRSAAPVFYSDDAKVESGSSIADVTSVNQSVLSVEYVINVPFSVPSDGKAHTVDIQQHDLKATYQHVVVPKLSKDVLLMAQLADWENLNLLPGNASIFYQGTFTGNAFLNMNNTTDTLSFVLGQDKKVIVTRERIKDYKTKSLFGNNVKETFGYEITIRNTKNEAIDLKIEDQIPVSSNSKIEADADELSGGNLKKVTGAISWNLNVKPAETQKLQLKYTVKYPKEAQIQNL